MEENLDFLLKDKNILEAEISDVMDRNGKMTIGLSITVGASESQIESIIEIVGNNISKIPTAFEILLTKSDLKKINQLIKHEQYL